MKSIYEQFFWQIFKLSVNTQKYIWIGVAASAAFATLSNKHAEVPLIVSLLNLGVLIFMEACINLIEKEAKNESCK